MGYLDSNDSFEEVFEKVLRKKKRLAEMDPARVPIQKPRKNGRAVIATLLKHNENPAVSDILRRIEDAEARIRQANLSTLPGPEKAKIRAEELAGLVRHVEQQKQSRINTLLKKLDKMQNEYRGKAKDPSAELLELQKAQLRNANVGAQEAVGRLRGLQRKDYSEADLLVLGAKSPEAEREAQRLAEKVPPYLSSTEGRAVLESMSEILELEPGTFRVGPDKFHVTSLLQHENPTATDLKTAMLHRAATAPKNEHATEGGEGKEHAEAEEIEA